MKSRTPQCVAMARPSGPRSRAASTSTNRRSTDPPRFIGPFRTTTPSLARTLIEAGADPTIENRTGTTPLRLAAINGSAEAIRLLIDAGVDPNAPLTPDGDTALMLAARTGLPGAVDVLLERGADVAAVESWGGTFALVWAINEGHTAVVARLLAAGAPVDDVSKVVAPRGRARGVEGTVPVDYDPEEYPQSYANGGFTPLLFAAREGEVESARLLLDAGADIDAIAADGKNALGLAIYNGHYDVATLLVDRGTNVNHPGCGRLHAAVLGRSTGATWSGTRDSRGFRPKTRCRSS